MIKRIVGLSTAAAVAVALAACGGSSNAPIIPPQVTQGIINGCTAACKFVPEVESVTTLLTLAPWVGTVENAIGLLCDAFLKWQAANPTPLSESLKTQVKATSFDMTLTNGQVIHVKGQAVR